LGLLSANMLIPYAKYQALGNSFIVLDRIYGRGRLTRFGRLAKEICDTQTGIGADGLLVISGTEESVCVDIFNADGSWAEKSGNGVRIAAMHLRNHGYIAGRRCRLRTGSGHSDIVFHAGGEKKRTISASLGQPIFDARRIPVNTAKRYFMDQRMERGGKSYFVSAVSIGNPHVVLFCDDFDFDWRSVGKMLEVDRLFPKRINVGFVRVLSRNHIEVRDWERGVGPTRSSGTGAAAAAAVSAARKLTGREVDVKTLAGTLGVRWDPESDLISIVGPVTFIGEGEYYRQGRSAR